MSFWSMFDSTASAYRPAISKGVLDGVQQDFTPGDPGVVTVLNGVACSYQPAKGGVKLLYAQRGQECDGVLYFGADPGDLVNCLIVLVRGRIGDTLTLIALGTGDPIQMGQTWVWPVDTQRIRQPQ